MPLSRKLASDLMKAGNRTPQEAVHEFALAKDPTDVDVTTLSNGRWITYRCVGVERVTAEEVVISISKYSFVKQQGVPAPAVGSLRIPMSNIRFFKIKGEPFALTKAHSSAAP